MGSKPMYDGNMSFFYVFFFTSTAILKQHQCWAGNTSVFDGDTVHDMHPFSMKQ